MRKKTFFENFYEVLKECVDEYDGKLSDTIRLAPDIFKLLINLLKDPMVPAKSKPLINATIAYFVAPSDVLPEETFGSIGYLDDLFLCAWTIKKLEKEIGYEVLKKNWEGEGELKDVIDDVYKKSREYVWGMEADIFEYVGLPPPTK